MLMKGVLTCWQSVRLFAILCYLFHLDNKMNDNALIILCNGLTDKQFTLVKT